VTTSKPVVKDGFRIGHLAVAVILCAALILGWKGATSLIDYWKVASTLTIVDYAEKFNQLRTENGLAPLTFTTYMNALAEQRAYQVSLNFSHEGAPAGMGENAQHNTGMTDDTLIKAWLASPGHKANMLNSSYTETGIGFYNGEYAVQLFR
jgi:uncharacterized protein YkwD